MGFSGNTNNETAQSWLEKVTGIPDTDKDGQYRWLEMDLMNVGR